MKNLFLFFLSFSFGLSAQTDSYPLVFKTLNVEDLSEDVFSENLKMISASRSQKTVGELPLTTYIVTKEEIHENGYNTLVDVLKTVPGIRVSQPGSATEGETFIMRGLVGNQNTKILINDVPIKPTFLLGMPIGAQLPIRQAERIEIIFGPAGALYGSDASAGVINIILRESERPVFVNADLNFGSESYRAMNLLLGGKFGRNKNIVKFTGFGSYTQFNDRRIFYNLEELHDFRNYRSDTLRFKGLIREQLLPNYNIDSTDSYPVVREFPHISRLFGLNLSWRNFKFFYENMYRRDHSALGFNPTAVSVSNSQTYTAESLNRYYLSWRKEGDKFSFQTLTNLLTSTSDKFSSTNYNLNVFGNILFNDITQEAQNDIVLRDSLWRSVQDFFLGGTRFKAATSAEGRIEQLISYHPNEQLEVTVGAAGYVNSAEYIDYAPRPVTNISTFEAAATSEQQAFNLGVFGQFYYVSEKINVIGGLQMFKELEGNSSWQYNPRIATIYKVNKDLSFRLFYGRAFRQGSPYYDFNTYFFIRNNPDLITPEPFSLTDTTILEATLKPEITDTYEVAAKWKVRKFKTQTELLFFRTKTENLISFDRVDQTIDNIRAIGVGYFNFKDTHSESIGIQANFVSKNIIPAIGLNTKLYIQRIFGEELLPKGGEIKAVRGQPDWTIQLKTDMKLSRTIRFNLFHLYQSESVSRLLNNGIDFNNNKNQYTIPGYYTLDAMLLGKLTDNFQIYLRVNNVFNKEYYGIDATGTPDDLILNPQSKRLLTAGVSYQL